MIGSTTEMPASSLTSHISVSSPRIGIVGDCREEPLLGRFPLRDIGLETMSRAPSLVIDRSFTEPSSAEKIAGLDDQVLGGLDRSSFSFVDGIAIIISKAKRRRVRRWNDVHG